MSPSSADAADRFERAGASTGSFAAQAFSPAHVGSAVSWGAIIACAAAAASLSPILLILGVGVGVRVGLGLSSVSP